MSVLGNVAPVWTHGVVELISPPAFWATPGSFVVTWAPLRYTFSPPIVCKPWHMSSPSVFVDTNLVNDVNDACFWSNPTCSFSIAQRYLLFMFAVGYQLTVDCERRDVIIFKWKTNFFIAYLLYYYYFIFTITITIIVYSIFLSWVQNQFQN